MTEINNKSILEVVRQKRLAENGEKMKYVFRRLLAGIVIIPAVAVAYVIGCGMLIALGAKDSGINYWNTGLELGVLVTLVFAVSVLGKVK